MSPKSTTALAVVFAPASPAEEAAAGPTSGMSPKSTTALAVVFAPASPVEEEAAGAASTSPAPTIATSPVASLEAAFINALIICWRGLVIPAARCLTSAPRTITSRGNACPNMQHKSYDHCQRLLTTNTNKGGIPRNGRRPQVHATAGWEKASAWSGGRPPLRPSSQHAGRTVPPRRRFRASPHVADGVCPNTAWYGERSYGRPKLSRLASREEQYQGSAVPEAPRARPAKHRARCRRGPKNQTCAHKMTLTRYQSIKPN